MRRREVTAADGRRLSTTEAGDPAGPAVFVFNGTPSAGHPTASAALDAERKGIRLVGLDRPGYCGSTSRPGRTVGDVAEDAAAVADALGIERFACWGISGGGPHSLACAALLPERVAAAASLGGVAPWDAAGLDWLAGMGEGNRAEFAAVLQGAEALRPFLERQAGEFRRASRSATIEELRSLLAPVDLAALESDAGEEVVELIAEGVADGVEGWLEDDLALAADWGFRLEQIRVPVLVCHGRQDRFVAATHGEWLAARIPSAEAWLDDDQGHLTLIERTVPAVHDWLLDRF